MVGEEAVKGDTHCQFLMGLDVAGAHCPPPVRVGRRRGSIRFLTQPTEIGADSSVNNNARIVVLRLLVSSRQGVRLLLKLGKHQLCFGE